MLSVKSSYKTYIQLQRQNDLSVGVEIFMLFTCSEKVHFFYQNFIFTKISQWQGCQDQGNISGKWKSHGILLMVREIRKDLESQGRVREFENKWLSRQSSENLFILFKRGKDILFDEIV